MGIERPSLSEMPMPLRFPAGVRLLGQALSPGPRAPMRRPSTNSWRCAFGKFHVAATWCHRPRRRAARPRTVCLWAPASAMVNSR